MYEMRCKSRQEYGVIHTVFVAESTDSTTFGEETSRNGFTYRIMQTQSAIVRNKSLNDRGMTTLMLFSDKQVRQGTWLRLHPNRATTSPAPDQQLSQRGIESASRTSGGQLGRSGTSASISFLSVSMECIFDT